MKNKITALFLLIAIAMNSCMAHTAGNPCRDPVTGRYTTCGGSGGGSSDPNSAWYIIGGFGAFAAIAGIAAAVTHTAQERAREQARANAGVPANPDSDGDGVPDGRDSCPRQHRGEEQFGSGRQNWLWGCPVVGTTGTDASVPVIYHDPANGTDTDNDGVIDSNDHCPNTPRGNQPPAPNSTERLLYDSGCPNSADANTASSPTSGASTNTGTGTGSTYVQGYFRSNGTYVHGYSRRGR